MSYLSFSTRRSLYQPDSSFVPNERQHNNGNAVKKTGRPPKHRLSPAEARVFRWSTAIFLAVILEGAARKWFLPAAFQALPYFTKDLIAALFIFNYPLQRRPNHWAPRLTQYVVAVSTLLLPSLILGLTEVPIGAILVYKNAVLWPLLAVAVGRRMTPLVLDRLIHVLLLCTLGMAILSVAQYYSGPGSILNRYAWNEAATNSKLSGIATAGDYVRSTGTFSYLAGLGTFSQVTFCIFLGRAVTQSRRDQTLSAALGLSGAVICGLTTGNRGIQVIMFVVSAATLVVAPKKRAIRLAGGILGAALIFLGLWNTSLSNGVISRWANTDSEEFRGRVSGSTTDQPWAETIFASPFGSGLGLYSGFSSYSGAQEQRDLAYNEGGNSKGLAEAGLLGLAANLVTIGMILAAASQMIRSSDALTRTRLVPMGLGLLIGLYSGFWYDHNATGMWWWATSLWLGEGLQFSSLRVRTSARQARKQALTSPGEAWLTPLSQARNQT